jgi:predicted alpha/beta hydrolase
MLDTERSRPDRAAAEARAAADEHRIAADDGRLLAATLFLPPEGMPATAPLTIVAGGTGIPRRYYARFASWLAEHGGRPTLTFDYRDIGGSRMGSLKASKVRMRDWCTLDVTGILAWTAHQHPGRPIHWVGHSLGGFAVGLAHNNHLVARQLNVATLNGYWQRMAVPERYRVLLGMGGLGPLIVRARGYFPGFILGGEDMPGPAFLEWRRWCMSPGFLFDDPTLPEAANFAGLRAPVRFGQVEDDTWATSAAVEAMAARFTGATERSIWRIRLANAGARRIGHHGFFRSEHRNTLWSAALKWLNA